MSELIPTSGDRPQTGILNLAQARVLETPDRIQSDKVRSKRTYLLVQFLAVLQKSMINERVRSPTVREGALVSMRPPSRSGF